MNRLLGDFVIDVRGIVEPGQIEHLREHLRAWVASLPANLAKVETARLSAGVDLFVADNRVAMVPEREGLVG